LQGGIAGSGVRGVTCGLQSLASINQAPAGHILKNFRYSWGATNTRCPVLAPHPGGTAGFLRDSEQHLGKVSEAGDLPPSRPV